MNNDKYVLMINKNAYLNKNMNMNYIYNEINTVSNDKNVYSSVFYLIGRSLNINNEIDI